LFSKHTSGANTENSNDWVHLVVF